MAVDAHPSRPRLPTEKGCTNTKSCGSLIQTAAADFSAYKIPSCPKHRRQMVFIHLSRSPDLRIISACTSLLSFPMTDFRPVQTPPRLQWRYRSGFTPDSLFSPDTLPALGGTQMCNFLFTLSRISPFDGFVKEYSPITPIIPVGLVYNLRLGILFGQYFHDNRVGGWLLNSQSTSHRTVRTGLVHGSSPLYVLYVFLGTL